MRIFISSPQVGLKDIRDEVLKNETRLNITFSAMESFLSSPNIPKEECLEHLRNSEYIILIIGPEYGSIDPETGNSFTEVEFDEAAKLSIGIFPYIYSKSVGDWQPQDNNEEIREKHRKFFEKVKLKGTLRAFQSVETLIQEIGPAIEQYKDRLSKPYKPFVDFKEYFDLFVGKQEKLFRHDYNFIGRDKEITELNGFLKSPKKILTMFGRGSIGKSKLIYELAKQNESSKGEWSRFLFIKENISFDDNILKNIPSGKSVIVLEDAHRYGQLSNVLSIFRNRDLSDRIKLIITLRPNGRDIVRMKLSQVLEPSMIQEMEIKGISIKDTERIVSEFIKNDPVTIKAIAEMTRDSPLIAIIGSRLLAEKKIRILKNDVEFRKIILDKFLEEFTSISKDKTSKRLLQYIAALSPIKPDDKSLIQALSKMLHVREDEVASQLGEFEKDGLLLRIGSLVKIVPDLVSDHILYEACVLPGVSTPFPKHVYSEFSHVYTSNLLRNVAELEWRIKSDNKRISLLDEVWEDIFKQFKDSSHYERFNLIRYIEKAAIYQPHQALRLVEFAIRNPSKNKMGRNVLLRGLSGWNHENVLRELPNILKSTSYHLDCLRKSCELLWELGKIDKRELNPNPTHPIRVLQDIAGYKNPKQSVIVIEHVIDFLEDVIQRGDFYSNSGSIFPILDEILRKEGELRFNGAEGFMIQAYRLNAKALLPLRNRSVRILERLFLQEKHPGTVTKSFTSLIKAFNYPIGSFGRVISKEEEDQWLPEQITILKIIKAGLNKNKAIALKVMVKKDLEWFANHARHNETKILAESIIKSINTSDYNFRLYRSLTGDLSEYRGLDYEVKQEQFDAQLDSNAAEVIQNEKTSQRVFKKLESALKELNSYGVNTTPSYILGKVAQKSSEMGLSLYLAVLKNKKSIVAKHSSSFLSSLKRSMAEDDFDKLIRKGVATKNKEIIFNVLQAYAWGGFGKLNDSDLKNLRKIQSLNIRELHPFLITVFTNMGKFQADIAKDLLLNVSVESDWSTRFCGSINNLYGIPLSVFSKVELAKILKKLIKLHLFKGDHYKTDDLLKLIGHLYPDLVLSFLLKRLKFSYSKESKGQEYAPLPYLGFDVDLLDLSKITDFSKLIKRIRNLSLYGNDTFWLPKLFQTISANYNDLSFEILSEWLKSKNAKKLIGLSSLLREGEEDVLFKNYKFIGDLIYEASLMPEECFRRVKSNIFSIAVGVERIYSHGQAPPQLVQLNEEANKIAEKFQTSHPAYKFYKEIAGYAEETIKDDLDRDEELSHGL